MRPVFIDIGSQTGKELSQALEEGYEVHAFEPNPKHWQFLKAYEDRATINYAAAWNRDGEIDFYSNDDTPERDVSSSVLPENTNNRKSPVVVSCIDTGRYLKGLDRDIEVIKIDAEGAEYYIIESILDNFDPSRIKTWRVEDHAGYMRGEEWFNHRKKVLERTKELGIIINEW